MNQLYPFFKFLLCGFFLIAFLPTISAQPLDWDYGRNDFEIPFENVDRHFIVHVPMSYNGDEPVPVVFIFHGTNGQGHTMWLNSKWQELCEAENFITVYPSSWKYVLSADGTKPEKWNFSHLFEIVEDPSQLKDDVGFIDKVLDLVIASFNVNEKKVYATGFSNGGSFVHTRILPEMNHRFAAIGCNAGLIKHEYNISGNLLPTVTMIGTKDGKILPAHPDTILPFDVYGILNDVVLGKTIDSTLHSLQLEKDYTVDSTQQAITFHFNVSASGNNNEWFFRVLNNVGHVYPHGNNNPWDLVVAPQYWAFFQQFEVVTSLKPEKSIREPFPCSFPTLISDRRLDVSCLFNDSSSGWEVLICNQMGQVLMQAPIEKDYLDIDMKAKGMLFISFFNQNSLRHTGKFIAN